MADIIAVCPVHGPFATRNLFGGTGSITIQNCGTNCPLCNRNSPIVDGTYDLAGSVVRAFQAPGVTRGNIEALKSIAEAEKNGIISAEEAEKQAAEISLTFAALLKWANGNAAALGVLITIIGLFIAIYAIRDSNLAGDQAHSDAQQEIQVQQKIYEALRQQHVPAPSQAVERRTSQSKQPPHLEQTQGAALPNRHERRKATAKARHQPRS